MLNFLNPILLWALPAGLVPLIIHLLNRQKKREIPFSTTHFLKQMTRKEMRRLKIRQIFLLIIRTLIFLLLILAFARPSLKSSGGVLAGRSASEIVVLIDNSLSLNRLDFSGSLFTQLKNRWNRLETVMQADDRLTVIQAVQPLKLLCEREKYSATLWKKITNEIQPTSLTGNLPGGILKAAEIFRKSPLLNKEIYILSDFQQNHADEINLKKYSNSFTNAKIFFLPLPGKEAESISIDTAFVVNRLIEKNLPLKISATFHNRHHSKTLNSMVSVVLNGKRVDQQNISLPGGEQKSLLFQTVLRLGGIVSGYVESEPDELLEDNRYFFNFFVPEKINILYLKPSPDFESFIPLILQPAVERGVFQYQTRPLSAWPSLNFLNYQVIILEGINQIPEGLNNRLLTFARDSKGIIMIPGTNLVPSSLNKFLSAVQLGTILSLEGKGGQTGQRISLGKIDWNHPLFEGLFEKPGNLNPIDFRAYYKLRPGPRAEVILRLKNNDPLLIGSKNKIINTFLFTVPLNREWTDFALRGFVVPLFYRLVYFSVIRNEGGANMAVAGEPYVREFSNLKPPFSFKVKRQGGIEKMILPEFKGSKVVLRMKENYNSGNYFIQQNGSRIAAYSVNHPAVESTNRFYTAEQLTSIFPGGYWISPDKSIAGAIEQSRFGIELWPYLLLSVLLLLLIEMLLAFTGSRKEYLRFKNEFVPAEHPEI